VLPPRPDAQGRLNLSLYATVSDHMGAGPASAAAPTPTPTLREQRGSSLMCVHSLLGFMAWAGGNLTWTGEWRRDDAYSLTDSSDQLQLALLNSDILPVPQGAPFLPSTNRVCVCLCVCV
jgi:hypothetical protein